MAENNRYDVAATAETAITALVQQPALLTALRACRLPSASSVRQARQDKIKR